MYIEWFKFLVNEIEINKESCLRKYKYLDCKNCINICKKQAVSTTENGIIIDKKKCDYCGLCKIYCPTRVINFNFKPCGIVKEHNFVYLCHNSLGGEYSSCLGILDLETILLTFSDDQIINVILSPGDCKSCNLKVDIELKKKVKICKNILKHFYTNKKVVIEPFFIKSFNRSDAINFFKNKILKTLTDGVVLSYWGKIKYQEQSLLAYGLKLLGTIKNEYMEESILPWYELTIDASKCNFCGTCYNLCPLSSISYAEENDTACIFQEPVYCTKCGLCIKACSEGAIKYLYFNNLKTLIENKKILLISKEFKRCVNCGSPILDSIFEVQCINCRKMKLLSSEIKEIIKTF